MSGDKGHVIRISSDAYQKLKQLKVKSKISYTATVEGLLETYDNAIKLTEILNGPKCFRVQDKVFEDVADARGHALLLSVKDNSQPQTPDVLVKCGEDDGG